ncbi:hypothetical protein MJG53_012905 [Ovis ammon polii x Ovis aries]|uniref:Uncharacterized protein n=2 Tax=Ovis TaxID=9935 RepID=A0AC11DVU1_SHEEP|nr:hypothetical protein MJT46_012566 [Ovis ammon polii x Ovis aries]KAI4573067.1 hypothetical protein MJG53_012905 [Ovis ammon polii x Ovis aries]
MTGFLLPPASRGTRRSCSRSRKRQTRRRRNPSSFVASCPTLLPFACVPGASPITLAFSPVVLTGPSTDGIPFALSLQRVPFVLPTPQTWNIILRKELRPSEGRLQDLDLCSLFLILPQFVPRLESWPRLCC